jgi:hypothetical protein
MSEMILRVAKAMFDKLRADDGPWTLAQGEGPTAITLDGSFDLTDVAIAAIDALHDPTKPMLDGYMAALESPLPQDDKRYPYYRTKAIKRFNAMIDGALK